MTMTILGIGALATILPLSLLFRHKPEQYGYLPDGQASGPVTSSNAQTTPQAVEVDIKPKRAFKSGTFWHIALAYSCFTMTVTATITHVMPYLSSIGITRSTAGLVATAIPLVSIAGRLGFAWLGDKRERRLVIVGTFAMMGLGLLCFGFVSSAGTWILVPFLVLFATGYGGCNAMRPSLVREYFGRNNFGTVFGLIVGVAMLGSVAGPPLAGWAYDNWGSYQSIWLIFIALPVVSLTLMLTLSPIITKVQPADKT